MLFEPDCGADLRARLRARSKELGLSQNELARRCGVNKGRISEALNDGRCDHRLLKKLAELLGVVETEGQEGDMEARNLLLVGGCANIAKNLTKHLTAEGFHVVHWEAERTAAWSQKPLPRDCSALLVLSGFLSHRGAEVSVLAAKQAGVPYAQVGAHKWSLVRERLIEAGIIAPTSTPAVHEEEEEVPMPNHSSPPPTKLPEPVLAAAKLLAEAIEGSNVRRIWLDGQPGGKVSLSYEIVQVISGSVEL